MVFSCLLTFFITKFSKKYFRNTTRVLNKLDPGQAQHYIRPDLGPNCLQRSAASDVIRRWQANSYLCKLFQNVKKIKRFNGLNSLNANVKHSTANIINVETRKIVKKCIKFQKLVGSLLCGVVFGAL